MNQTLGNDALTLRDEVARLLVQADAQRNVIECLRAENAELREALAAMLSAIDRDGRIKRGDYYYERKQARRVLGKD